MNTPLRILLLEDCAADAELVRAALNEGGYGGDVRTVETEQAYRAALKDAPDIVLSDYALTGFDGLRAREILRESDPETPFILVSGSAGEALVVRAMHAGATDYLLKSQLERLVPAIERALKLREVRAEYERAASELRRSQANLEAAQAWARMGSWELDLKCGGRIHWSRQTYVLTGRDPSLGPAELEEFLTYIHPEDRPRAQAAFAPATALRTQHYLEFRTNPQYGPVRQLAATINVTFDEQDRPSKAGGTLHDITEQKLAEERAISEKRRAEALLEAAPDPVVILDGEGRIVVVNARTEEVFGYSRAELLGQFVEILIPGQHHAAHVANRGLYLDKPRVRTMGAALDLFARRKDGSEFAVDISLSPLKTPNETLVISTIRDASERRRARDAIDEINASLERRVAERTRQFEDASRAKSEFLASMSHELRTPLNSIIGFSEMLKDGVLGDLTDKQRGFIADIHDAGAHLLSLINDILDLSKVEAGRMQLDLVAVDAAALLKASTLTVREKAHARRIRLDTALDQAPGSVLADERKVKQIVYNLLSNAVKFTPDGGTVRLRVRRCARDEVAVDTTMPARLLPLPSGQHAEFLEIQVEDTGEGIAEANLVNLFEPFMQGDNSLSRRHVGSGLGLALVRRLAELHGGTVGVATRVGSGSRFSVWLPCRAAGSEAGAPALPLALVIEDDDASADLISLLLRREGYEVIRSATAEEGIVRATKRKPQLISLDIHLSAMDGWEFLRRIKDDPALKDTPVVIISSEVDTERGRALGARGVLHKPLIGRELIALCRALSGGDGT